MSSRREDMGSWLEGTPAGSGGRLGLPEHGPGSRATLGRRVPAVVVDWLLSMGVALLVRPSTDPDAIPFLSADPTVTLVVFAVSTWLFVGLFGTTVGHRLLRIRVVRVADVEVAGPTVDRPPGIVAALVRTVLLCLVIPAVIWDADGRGMHDAGARTVLLNR